MKMLKYLMSFNNYIKAMLMKKRICSPTKQKCNTLFILVEMEFLYLLTKLTGNWLRNSRPFYKIRIKYHSSPHCMEADIEMILNQV